MLTALARGVPDRLPITVHQWQPYHRNKFMNGMTQFQAFKHVGMDASITLWQGVEREPSPNWVQTSEDLGLRDGETYTRHRAVTPEGEITWMTAANETTSYIAEPLIKTERDAELFLKYLPRCTLDKRLVTEWHDMTGDDGILRGGVAGFAQGGPWQDFCAIAGTQEAIFWAIDNPAFVHHFLDGLTRQRIEYIHRAMPGAAFDLIETGGGAASSTVISPAMFEEFCLPYDTRIHAALHEVGFKVTYHTCGGMMAILDLIWRNGCDASETLSPPGVGGDIRPEDRDTVREKLGSRVALIGGIDQGRLLTEGTPQEVEREVKACFQTFGRNGGYICSTSDHFFHAPVENLKAMARAARECRY